MLHVDDVGLDFFTSTNVIGAILTSDYMALYIFWMVPM